MNKKFVRIIMHIFVFGMCSYGVVSNAAQGGISIQKQLAICNVLNKNTEQFYKDNYSDKDSVLCNRLKTLDNQIKCFVNGDQEIESKIAIMACQVHPVTNPIVVCLAAKWLNIVKSNGTELEKDYYKDMKIEDFFVRLYETRPLICFTARNQYKLRKRPEVEFGTQFVSDFFSLHTGSPDERTKKKRNDLAITLNDSISCDESQIAGLVGMSVPTFFINNGSRGIAKGLKQDDDEYEKEGVLVGLVGPSFEQLWVMAYKHMMVTHFQNTKENGYGGNIAEMNRDALLLRLWADFFHLEHFPLYDDIDKNGERYVVADNKNCSTANYLDIVIYKEYIKEFLIKPFLQEAQMRAQSCNKMAYVHAVGVGLSGDWMASSKQVQCMLDMYEEVLKNGQFDHIGVVDFSWFTGPFGINNVSFEGVEKLGDRSPVTYREGKYNDIVIRISYRNLADKLPKEYKDYLLVGLYGWDHKSFVGNEYWLMLFGTGDPAAAGCSLISQLQNPDINPMVKYSMVLYVRKVLKFLESKGFTEENLKAASFKEVQEALGTFDSNKVMQYIEKRAFRDASKVFDIAGDDQPQIITTTTTTTTTKENKQEVTYRLSLTLKEGSSFSKTRDTFTGDFKERFEKVGINVKEYNGDTVIFPAEYVMIDKNPKNNPDLLREIGDEIPAFWTRDTLCDENGQLKESIELPPIQIKGLAYNIILTVIKSPEFEAAEAAAITETTETTKETKELVATKEESKRGVIICHVSITLGKQLLLGKDYRHSQGVIDSWKKCGIELNHHIDDTSVMQVASMQGKNKHILSLLEFNELPYELLYDESGQLKKDIELNFERKGVPYKVIFTVEKAAKPEQTETAATTAKKAAAPEKEIKVEPFLISSLFTLQGGLMIGGVSFLALLAAYIYKHADVLQGKYMAWKTA